MRLYVDESGVITLSRKKEKRFFILCFVQSKNFNKAIREFRKAKKDYIECYPDCGLSITDEIKGSEMTYKMKEMIFNRLNEKTDIIFHFKVVDNYHLYPKLRSSPSITFNYLNYLSIKEICSNLSNVEDRLVMLIDERNQSVGSLNSLQEYLQIEFVIKEQYFNEVKVEYKDSRTKDMIQIADVFSNTIFRICKAHALGTYDKRNRNLLSLCRVGTKDYFPREHNNLDIFE